MAAAGEPRDGSAEWLDPRPVCRRVLAAAQQRAVHVGNDLNWVAASVWHEVQPAAAFALAAVREDVLLLLAAPHTPETNR